MCDNKIRTVKQNSILAYNHCYLSPWLYLNHLSCSFVNNFIFCCFIDNTSTEFWYLKIINNLVNIFTCQQDFKILAFSKIQKIFLENHLIVATDNRGVLEYDACCQRLVDIDFYNPMIVWQVNILKFIIDVKICIRPFIYAYFVNNSYGK